MDIYDKIEYLIKLNNISRKDMCEGANISYTTYTSMLNRRSERILMDTIISISVFFNVTVDYLMNNDIPLEPVLYKNNIILNHNESFLLNNFNKLNSLGKEKALERIAEMTQIPLYQIGLENTESEKIKSLILKEDPKNEEEFIKIVARGKGVTTISKEEFEKIEKTAIEVDNIDDYF